MKPVVSLIVSFYNDVHWLSLIFAALKRQSFKAFEVIIADDGSTPENVAHITELITTLPFSVINVWHKDEGWRKNIILNQAIKSSTTDYLIFIDGDCIPHKHFIKEHYLHRQAQVILAGRRVNLSSRISKSLIANQIENGFLEKGFVIKLFLHRLLFKDGSHTENGIYIKPKFLRKRINKKKDKGILGSNFSMHKKDIYHLNGFDERYLLPAVGEDTDIWHRALIAGFEIKTLKHLAIQYHKFHKKLDRHDENLVILNDTIDKQIFFTQFGLVKRDNK